MIICRLYQEKGINDIREAFESGLRSVCITMPTGAGKTVLFSEIARRSVERGTNSVILVHRDSLLTQASNKLRDFGVEHSIIAPGHRHFGDKVSVASVQTLVRRLDRHKFDFIIIDEAHHATANSYMKILNAHPESHILGVTATPERADGCGLGSVFQKLIQGPTVSELIADGYLVEPLVYAASKQVDLSSVRTQMGDYDQKQLAAVMDARTVTGDAVDHYRRICPGQPAVAFCVSIKHAEDVAAQFAEAGYRAASISGNDPINIIRERLAGLESGSCQVLASCDLISEGLDCPAISSVILLRPTKSKNVYFQQVGRGLRPIWDDAWDATIRQDRLDCIASCRKPRAIILDHAGNCFRFGLPDDPQQWSLEGRKKRKGGSGEAPIHIRQCPKCFCTHRPAPACPECGHVYIVAGTTPATVAGELSVVEKSEFRRQQQAEVRAARTLDDLRAIRRRRGYAYGWEYHVMRERGY